MTPLSVIITIAAYFVILFTVSYIAGRKADNAGFFVGNRKSSWYVVAFAMVGSAISGVTYVSVPGMVAASNFGYLQMVLGFIAGQLIIAYLLVPLFYKMNLVSIYEYLENRFGMSSYRTGAWFFFISKMLGAAVRLFLVCLTLQLLVFEPFGLPFLLNVAITVALVWLYTFQGGVKSLIWTDSLKTFCLVVSVVLCIWYIASDLNLSFTGMVSTIADSDMSRIFFFDDVNSKQYFFKQFLAGAFTMIAMTGLDQDMMQRNLSCATPRDSQKNIVLTAVSQIFVIFLFLVLGVLLYIYMDRSGLAMPEKGDQVFSQVAVNGGLPVFVGILFVIGLISSTYSAAGSALTALTTSFTVDILDGTKPAPPAAHRPCGDGPRHGAGDPRLRIPCRRQRHQSGLQGRQLHLRPDFGYVRFRYLHASQGARRLDAPRGARRSAAERPAAIRAAGALRLSDRFRTARVQCAFHRRGNVAARSSS